MLPQLALPPAAQQIVERAGGSRRLMILGVGVATVLLILGVTRWATKPEWVRVSSSLPLESVGSITERLDEAGIQHRLEDGGSALLVPAPDLARARVTLARDGGMPAAGRPGLELFDQPAWGMTDFTQRINYRRALEGELERTIGEMRGIDGVKVHLAMDESGGILEADRPVRASVVLKLGSGLAPSDDIVQGIAHLVASSVEGIEAERVTVLDDTGRLLSTPYEPGSATALASRELRMRREIEQYLESKAEQLVTQVVGPGNVRVQVSAAINFDRVERTTETVDPEQQVVSTEQRSEIVPGPEGGAGSTNVTASYLNSRTMETFSGAVGGVERLAVAVLLNERTADAATGATPTPWTPAELSRVETLVKNAVGVDGQRGDMISVVSLPFRSNQAEPEPKVDLATLVQTYHQPAITVLGLLLACFVALRAIRVLRAPPLTAEALAPVAADQAALPAGGASAVDEQRLPLLDPAGVTVTELLRKRVVIQVEEQPDVSARLIRSWLKEA